MAQPNLRIGEVARLAGVHPRTLRYYERIGLLIPAARLASGYRQYAAADVERLRFIRRAQGLGLSLAEVAGILAVRQGGAVPCQHVRALAEAKAAEVTRRIAELEDLRQDLLHLAEAARVVEPACTAATSAICLAFEAAPGAARHP